MSVVRNEIVEPVTPGTKTGDADSRDRDRGRSWLGVENKPVTPLKPGNKPRRLVDGARIERRLGSPPSSSYADCSRHESCGYGHRPPCPLSLERARGRTRIKLSLAHCGCRYADRPERENEHKQEEQHSESLSHW